MKRYLLGIIGCCVILVATNVVSAAAKKVPQFLNYQSLLYDDGGNLISDGETNLTFRIMDANGSVLFEEYQTVNVINGYVSAIVGNGLDANNAPVGGIPVEILSPSNGTFYLEVTADGYPPEAGMEIVSVPYSMYSQEALTVADNSIGSGALKNSIIERSHLTNDLISQLADEMGTGGMVATPTDITNLQTSYSSSDGATNIGVSGSLNYSTGTNIQTVVQDLDHAVLDRQNNIIAHANTDIAIAHPNGQIPINRLDTDVCTRPELEGHTHTGGADGATLNGHAFWVDSGSVGDNGYISVASGFNVNNCKIVIGVYDFTALAPSDNFDPAFCARYCREPGSNRFRVRCIATPEWAGPMANFCENTFGDTNVEGGSCDTPGSPSYTCHASYMVFCPR